MPYLHFNISSKLSESDKAAIIKETGKLIELIPGKTENVLMIRLDDDANLFFRGEKTDCAYVSINLYMTAPFQYKQTFAKALSESFCRITSIEPQNLFMSFSEFANWSANGDLK